MCLPFASCHMTITIRESVDSLCRDGADMPMQMVEESFCLSFLFLRDFFHWLFSKLAEVIPVVLSRIHCNHYQV